MPPGLQHAVYTSESSVAEGCHFFTSRTLLDTLVALSHSFICHEFITNTTHPETRVLLRRLQHFAHRGLVRGVSLKPSEVHHLPNLEAPIGGQVDSKAVFDFLSLCTLSLFAEALDPRTYVGPGQALSSSPNAAERKIVEELCQSILKPQERREICLARGCARECLEWFRDHFEARSVTGDTIVDLPAVFIKHFAQAILRYKFVADKNDIAADGHAWFSVFQAQIEASLYMFMDVWIAWRELTADGKWLSDGLDYCVRGSDQKGSWLRETLVPNHHHFRIFRKAGASKQSRSIDEMEAFGRRDRDEKYLIAKQEQHTITLDAHL